jgi:shikimate kinase
MPNCDQNVADGPTACKFSKPIVLIGMMGTGKTQLGRLLAKSMSLPFFDTDIEFEAAAGLSIADYFKTYGEDAFRDGEFKVLDRLLDSSPKIIAAGGGIITLPATRAILRDRAIVVWLQASPEALAKRCAGNNKRPLLQGGDAQDILAALLEKRQGLYEEVSHFTISTEHSVGDDARNAILKGLESWQKQ